MADVSIATVSAETARGEGLVVWVSATVGYCFYVAADDDLEYIKTTDGGATWSGAIQVSGNDVVRAFSVCYDQETPGDTTGTVIHITWVQSTADSVHYRSLDTNGDSLGTNTTVAALTSALGNAAVWCSIGKSVSGHLGIAFDADGGNERGFYISTDAGASWGSNLNTATFVEDPGAGTTPDFGRVRPASGTGDDDDFWMLYQDGSANELTLKLWDASAGADSESTTIVTLAENATDLVGQRGWSAGIRLSDGHLILAAVTEYDTATADHRVFDLGGLASITELTAIATDVDDHYHPAVYVDPNDDEIFVAFNGLRDGSEDLGVATKIYYVSSSDGGTTWSAGSMAYMEGTAEAAAQVWCAPTGPLFYPVWRTGTSLKGNAVNSVAGAGGGSDGEGYAFMGAAPRASGQGVKHSDGSVVVKGAPRYMAWSEHSGQSYALMFDPDIGINREPISGEGEGYGMLRGYPRLIALGSKGGAAELTGFGGPVLNVEGSKGGATFAQARNHAFLRSLAAKGGTAEGLIGDAGYLLAHGMHEGAGEGYGFVFDHGRLLALGTKAGFLGGAVGPISTGLVLDEYGIANLASNSLIDSNHALAQSFLASAVRPIIALWFSVRRQSSSTGSLRAHLHAASGTPGSDAVPTGAPLASSALVNIPTMGIPTNTPTLFRFPLDTPIMPSLGAAYSAVIEGIDVGPLGITDVGFDGSSPTHAGNLAARSTAGGAWSAVPQSDLIFRVEVEGPTLFGAGRVLGRGAKSVAGYAAARTLARALAQSSKGCQGSTLLSDFAFLEAHFAKATFGYAGRMHGAPYLLSDGDPSIIVILGRPYNVDVPARVWVVDIK